ncbi:MAG: nucleotidyltransferase family protein [bacterium]
MSQPELAKLKKILKQQGVKSASLFGSFARGEATAKSDIDLLVDLGKGKTLFDLSGLKLTLEDALGREVDLVTKNALKPAIRSYILKDLVKII